MVWIALGLLALTTTIVGLNTLGDRWTMEYWRYRGRAGLRYDTLADVIGGLPLGPSASGFQRVYTGVSRAIMHHSGFALFANWWVFGIFLSFCLPIWSLSFSTEALGGEREARTLPWLTHQPISRPLIYLAKFVALMPFSMGLNLGGFFLLCWAAGAAGRPAFELFWFPVALATLAFCSLFHFMGAAFRRPAIVAIVYSFFLETVLGNMPGTMKRISIGFYTRCMMFERAESYGIQPEKPSIYLPVDEATAITVLVAITVIMLGVGMWVFSRSEYVELA
jgi:hypothetical protein